MSPLDGCPLARPKAAIPKTEVINAKAYQSLTAHTLRWLHHFASRSQPWSGRLANATASVTSETTALKIERKSKFKEIALNDYWIHRLAAFSQHGWTTD